MSHSVDVEPAQSGDVAPRAKSSDFQVAAALAVTCAVAAFVAVRAVTPELFPSISTRALSASVRGVLERTRLQQDVRQVYGALQFGAGCGLLWLVMRGDLKGRSRLYKTAVLCVLALLLLGTPLTIVLELMRSNDWLVFALGLFSSTIVLVALLGLAAAVALKAGGRGSE